ncbi:MAG: XdhC family protein [Solirubrobacteraceae bacterium]
MSLTSAPRLLIFGAIAYANHLSHLARVTGWRPYVIDPRARFANRASLPDAEEVVIAWPAPALEQLGGIDRDTYLAVLSNDPKIDDEVLLLALRADPAYIGAMGSRHAQERRRERLLGAGVSEEDLQRISAPVGLDLGALSSAETALSIMAELVAVRHRRPGGRLSGIRVCTSGRGGERRAAPS